MKKYLILIVLLILSILLGVFTYSHFLDESKTSNKFQNTLKLTDDYILYNGLFKETSDDIVILRIDDKTVDAFQTNDTNVFSMTKTTHAKIIENIFEKYGASTLGIDIIFGRKGEPKDILKLQETLEKFKDKVVIGTQGEGLKPLCEFQKIDQGMVKIISDDRLRKTKISFDKYTDNCSSIENKIYVFSYQIFKNYLKDLNLFQKFELYEKTVSKNKYKGSESDFIKDYTLNQKKIDNQLFNASLKYSSNNEIYFSYHKNPNIKRLENGLHGYESYSLHDIYEGKKDINLEGKIVLIGEVGSTFHDEFFSPVDFKNKMPGVEFHANIISSILNNTFIKPIKSSTIVILVIIFSVLLSLSYIIRLRYGIIFLFLYIFTNINVGKFLINTGGDFGLFIKHSYFLYPVSFFVLYGIVLFILIYIYKYIEEIITRKLYLKKYNLAIKDKDFIKKAFGQYVSPGMVEAIIKDPNKLKLGGEKKELTMFFSDLVGFTSISETMDSKSLFTFMNMYFEEMGKILIKNDGTIDKYIGDALMGFYGAPLDIENPEYKACKTALEQKVKLKELNETFKKIKKDFPTMGMRIGINTGPVSHGNLGGRNNINYTVIGDAVNLASRLEAVNKQYGSSICISEGTYKKVKDQFIIRELDTIRVKGKKIGKKIYELIGNIGELENVQFINNYESGLKHYYNGEYDKAIEYFNINTNDEPSKIMRNRCEDFKNNNTKLENGVYVMTTK